MKSVVLVAAVVLVLSGCVSLEEAVTTPPETNVSYPSADGTILQGYLAVPEGAGPHPAVLMIHEWWGLNEDVTIMADALSDEGFVVLAPDAFRGRLATSVPQAISMNSSTPENQIFADLDGAYSFLRSHSAVDPDRVATMGFCFGGRQSMYLGIRGSELAAVVTLYGSGLVTDPEELGNLAANGPVLGIFGDEDNSIPVREVREFESALQTIGAEHQISIYEGVGHAFVKSSTFRGDGPAGEAWDEMVAFLKDAIR
jgi:carboxymethylenebutenolidase